MNARIQTPTTETFVLGAAAASKLFTAALAEVQSESIRAWAKGQRPVWIKIIRKGVGWVAGRPVLECPPAEQARAVATFITCSAMGL